MSCPRSIIPQQQLLIATIVVLIVIQVSYFVAAYNPLDLDQFEKPALENSYDSYYPSADKRYGGNRGGRRDRSDSSRYYRNVPDTECLRQFCTSDKDCCRRYPKCDKGTKKCYDCWYGKPCTTSRDCCDPYPNCDRREKKCQWHH